MQSSFADILIRLGWAFLCGFSAFMVPLLFRRAAFADSLGKRIACHVAALLFLGLFVWLAIFLWGKRADDVTAPAPSELPAPPALDLPPASP